MDSDSTDWAIWAGTWALDNVQLSTAEVAITSMITEVVIAERIITA